VTDPQKTTRIQPYQRLAAYYDRLMDYIDYSIWVEDIIEAVAPFKTGKRWLDISCGTGSMALLLAQRGIHMTAVDLSPHMIDIARAKAAEAGMDISFKVGDMTSYMEKDPFDVIINLHDGLNYLLDDADVQKFMDNAFRLLKDQGILLFDVVTPLLCQTHFRGYREIFADELGGYERQTSYDPQSQLAESTFTLQTEDEDRVDLESHIQRAYELEEVEAFCKRSPFDWWQILDDESLEAADADSERLWVMLRKSK
jgi:SAM-dependent methyltransferase